MVHDGASAASTRKAGLPLPPSTLPIQVCARRDADQSPEESWENEGGHLPRLDRASGSSGAFTTADGEIERLTTEVRLMASTLSRDFASGRVGTRYNTYAHRSRVLRQLTAKLDAMRERKASFEAQEQRQ
ncbi:hypothetical protein [Sphingomonas oligoaromativorans]|uniref:hypothetical protein n=1 Tax=Sphingomonas oligoaromativorans TaxID=575322 RepID=UPI00141F73D4|nr:hypothetical protein [Sphingomonas oligoaromativorans]NIJ34064.1 hypothetical protein [Sphingomonas oligoaromativorans]